ncbi:MAG: iron chaperone [Candidatus Cryosericum sp.]
MDSGKSALDSIDAYIAQFPDEVQERLRTLRKIIRDAAPEAEEKISYRMPTFVLHGNLVYFAAFKNHIGLYPAPSGVDAFMPELSAYRSGKGSIQFPMDKPLPSELISRIVKFRVAENTKRADERLKNKARKG